VPKKLVVSSGVAVAPKMCKVGANLLTRWHGFRYRTGMEAVCWFTHKKPARNVFRGLPAAGLPPGPKMRSVLPRSYLAGLPPGITEMRACACPPSLPICRWSTAGEAKRTTVLSYGARQWSAACRAFLVVPSCRVILVHCPRSASSSLVLVACSGRTPS
jgi:hypothetical protein